MGYAGAMWRLPHWMTLSGAALRNDWQIESPRKVFRGAWRHLVGRRHRLHNRVQPFGSPEVGYLRSNELHVE